MGITLALSAAINGLNTAQKGLDLTSANLANVNTEGYSRKIFTQENRVINGVGVGSQAGLYSRAVDDSLVRDIRKESGTYQYLEIKESYINRVQDLFGSPEDNSSVSHLINDMQMAFEQLSVDTGDINAQNYAVETAVNAIEQINKLSSYMQNLRYEADRALADAAVEIAGLLEKVDALNTEIVRTNNLGTQSSEDLKDQRDRVLLELNEKLDCTVYKRDNGEVVILTKGGRSLLDQDPAEIRHASSTQTSAWLTYSGNTLDGFWAGKYDITNEIKSGELKGLIEMRDDVLPELQAELDELAQKLQRNVNQVFNRGASYPDMVSQVEGTRTFMDFAAGPNLQNINIASGDVRITLFNQDGTQAYTTTLSRMGFTNGDIYNAATHAGAVAGAPDTLCSYIENWLTVDANGPTLPNASVEINSDGKFEINLGTTNYGIAFRDEASTTIGSEHTDASIQFDVDGDGNYDQTADGFSNFFGLGDFFETPWKNWMLDSNIVSKNYDSNLAAPATINFSDETNGLQFGSITVLTSDDLVDVVDKINNDPVIGDFVHAQLVEEGSGYRLRLVHRDGEELAVTEAPGTNFLSNLGMDTSSAAVSTVLQVRNEYISSPSLMKSGSVQYDRASGEYFVSTADNSVASELDELFAMSVSFQQAGYLGTGEHTFAEYGTAILSHMAGVAGQTETLLDYQKTLTENLNFKAAEESGVNTDEELSNLMIYEQAYAAAARVITATKDMMDILTNMLN